MAQHSPEYIREEIKRLLKYAPPEMRAAAIALLPAALEAAPATKPAKAEKGEKEDK